MKDISLVECGDARSGGSIVYRSRHARVLAGDFGFERKVIIATEFWPASM